MWVFDLSVGVYLAIIIIFLTAMWWLLVKNRVHVTDAGRTFARIKSLPQVSVPNLQNITYAHGGFMGAAVEMLRDPGWVKMLELLTPETYNRLLLADAATQHTITSSTIISLLENNPVVAAFGVTHCSRHDYPSKPRSLSHNRVVVEWDIYSDTSIPSISEMLTDKRPKTAQEFVDRTLVAHGSILHTICERIFGVSMHSSIMKHTAEMTIDRWLSAYHKALNTLAPDVTAQKSTKQPVLTVFLDVKSSNASPEMLHLLIEGLNNMGIHVWGAGSFIFKQLRWQPFTQKVRLHINGEDHVLELPPTKQIFLFGHVAEIQQAVRRGVLQRGSTVLFNGGSMLDYDASLQQPYSVDARIINSLRRYALDLGFYVQEQNIDREAVRALTDLVQRHPDVFPVGFNYSNISGRCTGDVRPTKTHITNGFVIPRWLQPLLKKSWDFTGDAEAEITKSN